MTKIKQTFVFKDQSGKVLQAGLDYSTLIDWAKTLPKVEYDEFSAAQARQNSYVLNEENAGNLVVGNNSHTYSNQDSATANIQTDPTWQIYFNRWCEAHNMTFSIENSIE